MDWRVIVLVIGAGLFGVLVVAILAGAARVSRYEDMEIKDELQPDYHHPMPEKLPSNFQPSLVRPYIADEDYRLELTSPMQPWEQPAPGTVYESERAQQP